MSTQFVARSFAGRPTLCFHCDVLESGLEGIKAYIAAVEGVFSPAEVRLKAAGKEVTTANCISLCHSPLASFVPLEISLRIVGGKGGFGSLLRGGPSGPGQKKTTNFGSMRDLEGRRLKNVDVIKKVHDYLAQQRGETVPKDDSDDEQMGKKKRKKKRNADGLTRKEQREKEEEEERLAERDSHYDPPPKPLESEIALTPVDVTQSVHEAYKLTRELEKKEKQSKPKQKAAKLWNDGFSSDDSEEDDGSQPTNAVDSAESKSSGGEEKKEEEKEVKEEKEEHKDQMQITDPHAERAQGLKRKHDEVTPSESKSAALEKPALTVDLSAFGTAEELLAKIGAEGLKTELQRLGLKCGGTPAQRAERLFAIKGKSPDQFDSSLLAANAKRRKV